ncbi:MAG: cystathionine gamma-synthase [Propionibacteriaceae bacterium]|nr:cystathionine gamma-synthase [Propionibacteriaceae bacterium]
MSELSRVTKAVRAGINTDPVFGAVVPPIQLSSTYTFSGYDERREHVYSRSSNPTRDLLGKAIAELESGYDGLITSSGTGACLVCVEALLPVGGTLLAPFDCYGGSWRLFDAKARKGHFELRLVDFTDESSWTPAIADQPSLVWLESPSNPLLRVSDIAQIAAAAKAVGATVVADNTFATPALLRPIELGADVVVHSVTKYLNGHSDLVAGAVVAATQDLHTELSWWANALGVTGSALDSYLSLRGLRTFHLRMAAAQQNAAEIADFLVQQPTVRNVYYPGLKTHPSHELATRQQSGYGAIVSFELADEAAAASFLNSTSLFCLAESLGGVESLVSHPATMTHQAVPEALREAAGITPGLIRLSIGVEDVADLITDLSQALANV